MAETFGTTWNESPPRMYSMLVLYETELQSSAALLLSRATTTRSESHCGASQTMDRRAGGVSRSPGLVVGLPKGPLVVAAVAAAVAAGGALTQPTLLAASASIRGREQRGLLPGPGLMTVMATESRFAETVAGRREAKISH